MICMGRTGEGNGEGNMRYEVIYTNFNNRKSCGLFDSLKAAQDSVRDYWKKHNFKPPFVRQIGVGNNIVWEYGCYPESYVFKPRKSKTEIARRCLFNMVSAMHNELGCKGALDSDFSHCKSCVMSYAVNEWDGESTGCRVQDMEKSLDWIDGGVY